MLFDIEFIHEFNKPKSITILNKIVIEPDMLIRQELILNLYSLDLIHTRGEHTINKPLIVFQNVIFLNEDKREPTNQEYKEWFETAIENTRYKYQNIKEYKKVLTRNKLRVLLFNLFFEDILINRMNLLTNYLYRKSKVIKDNLKNYDLIQTGGSLRQIKC